jgi:hypothetical protein
VARPFVHRMLRLADRPGGGVEWVCPFCEHRVIAWPLYRQVMVQGPADAVHVRDCEEIPVHLDDRVIELTEADEHWLGLHTIAWSQAAG